MTRQTQEIKIEEIFADDSQNDNEADSNFVASSFADNTDIINSITDLYETAKFKIKKEDFEQLETLKRFYFNNRQQMINCFYTLMQKHLVEYPYDFDIDMIKKFNKTIKEDFPDVNMFDDWETIGNNIYLSHKWEIDNANQLKKCYENTPGMYQRSTEDEKKLRRNLRIKYGINVADKYFDYWTKNPDLNSLGFKEIFINLHKNYVDPDLMFFTSEIPPRNEISLANIISAIYHLTMMIFEKDDETEMVY
jgi:acyl carrier protein